MERFKAAVLNHGYSSRFLANKVRFIQQLYLECRSSIYSNDRFTFKIISSLLHLKSLKSHKKWLGGGQKNEESGLLGRFLAVTSASGSDGRTRRMTEEKLIGWIFRSMILVVRKSSKLLILSGA